MLEVAHIRRIDRSLLVTMLLALVFYLAIFPNVLSRLNPLTGDEPFYVMTAISLLHDHDLNEANNYQLRQYDAFYPPETLPAGWQGWPSFPRTLPPHPAISQRPGLHTKHGLGLSFLIAIPYAIAGRIGSDLLIMLCAVLLAGQMYLIAREAGASSDLAQLIAIGLAIAAPLGIYAQLIFPEIPAALLLIYAVRRLAATSNTLPQWFAMSAAIGFLPWLHQRFAPSAAILTVWLIIRAWQDRSRRWSVLGLAPVIVGGISLLLYNEWLYGIPVESGHDHAGFSGLAGTVNGAMGLLLDAQWGLWIMAPITLLALAAVPWWYKQSPQIARVAISAIVPYLVVIAAYKVWWGEWGPAARYLVPIVPFAAGTLAVYLGRATIAGRVVAAGTWGFGMILSLIGYVNPQRFYHQPDGINKLYAHLGSSVHIHIEHWLVVFQPYSLSPFPERLWISLFAFALFFLVTIVMRDPRVLPGSEISGLVARAKLRWSPRYSFALPWARTLPVGLFVVVPTVALYLAAGILDDSNVVATTSGVTTGETVTVPFARGRLGVETRESYSGSVTITVSGYGQAAAKQYSDAFYIFGDGLGNAKAPEHVPDFSLWIDGRPVDSYVKIIPPYNASHAYTIVVQGDDAPFEFGIGDASAEDNRGSFTVALGK